MDFLANYTTNATALIESEYFDLLTNGTNITRADAYFFYNNTAKSIIASFDLDNSSGLNLTEFTNMLEYGASVFHRACHSRACLNGLRPYSTRQTWRYPRTMPDNYLSHQ